MHWDSLSVSNELSSGDGELAKVGSGLDVKLSLLKLFSLDLY